MRDTAQYLKYSDERSRPFVDLLARVPAHQPRFIADLGCGPGHLTRTLVDRWPTAHVQGVDHSAEMLEKARNLAIPGRLEFEHADIATWKPKQPVDLLVSNAALQWLPSHEVLIPHLAALLSSRGTLAVQMPYHFETPAHQIIQELKSAPRWRQALEGVGLDRRWMKPVIWYVEQLYDLSFAVDAWQTTYIHILSGENPVLEWFKGTALRPLLQALDSDAKTEFLNEIGKRFRTAYPARNGITLLSFPRMFLVATQRV
jgi:trans-aconitate 2-methyltransferase